MMIERLGFRGPILGLASFESKSERECGSASSLEDDVDESGFVLGFTVAVAGLVAEGMGSVDDVDAMLKLRLV